MVVDTPGAPGRGRPRRGGLVGVTAGVAGAAIVALAGTLVVSQFDDRAGGAPAPTPSRTAATDAVGLAVRAFARFQDPPYDPSFGGSWVSHDDPGGARVVVAVVGTPSPALAAALARAGRTRVLATVPARHSWGELEELTLRITRDRAALRRLGVELVEWGPAIGPALDPAERTTQGGRVTVRLHRYAPALERALMRRYPGEPLCVLHDSAAYPVHLSA